MKQYIKQALDTLSALDCRLDHQDRETRTDRWRFTHPNAPDEFFTINFRSSETAARAVVQRAKVAAGLATSDSLQSKPKINQRQKAQRAEERTRIAAARALAEAKEAEIRAKRIEAQAARNHRELDRLIRGPVVSDAPRASALTGNGLVTIEQVADATGLADKVLWRAIDAGRIEAYQCGKQVKVKASDVRAWMRSS